jgi:hypothetical protein
MVRDAAAELESGKLTRAHRLLVRAVAIEPDNTKARYYFDLAEEAIKVSEFNTNSSVYWYPTLPPRPVQR